MYEHHQDVSVANVVQLVAATVAVEVVKNTDGDDVVSAGAPAIVDSVVFEVEDVEESIDSVDVADDQEDAADPDVVDVVEADAIEVVETTVVEDSSNVAKDADDVADVDAETEDVDDSTDVVEAEGTADVEFTDVPGVEDRNVVNAVWCVCDTENV